MMKMLMRQVNKRLSFKIEVSLRILAISTNSSEGDFRSPSFFLQINLPFELKDNKHPNMIQVSCKTTINISADAIWRVISDFGAAGQYLSGLVNCTVEEKGVGALRTLTSTDGSKVIERLETLDETAHQLSYTLLTDTPFCNCLTTMIVRDPGSSLSELEWSATFEPTGIPAIEAKQMLESSLAINCLALKKFMER